jgi:multidrug efflux pump subunit AcrA (membrane-fusion protein)
MFNGKTLGGAVLALLLILIFFSRTLYTHNLPTVTATSPTNGKLSKNESAKGVAEWAAVSDLYAEVAGYVEEVLARPGDPVKAGQPVLTLRYDQEEVQKKLEELAVTQARYALDLENIHLRMGNTQRKMAELQEDVYEAETVSDFELGQLAREIAKLEADAQALEADWQAKLAQEKAANTYELEQAQADLAKAEADHGNVTLLYNGGHVSRQEYLNSAYALEAQRVRLENRARALGEGEAASAEAARQALEAAQYTLETKGRQYQHLQASLAENEKKSQETLEAQEKNREKQLKEYAYELQTLGQDLKAKELDLQTLALQEAAHTTLLETYSRNLVLTAPAAGTVLTLDLQAGQFVNANALLARFGVGRAFIIQCELSLDNNFTLVGDPCVLSNTAHTLTGAVTHITPVQNAKKITVAIESDQVAAGETFDLSFEKESAQSYILVPNGALNRDAEGYFLYQIKRRDGILGKEFYTVKQRVYIGDADPEYTEITSGVTFFEPVALVSDKPFDEGETIQLKNESACFAN